MKKKLIIIVLIIISFLALVFLIENSNNYSNNSSGEDKLVKITKNNPDEAAFAISEQLLKSGTFEGVSISDYQMLDYIRLKEYNDLTEKGKIFSYELIYKFKTDDDRAFIDNKITGEFVATNVWIDDVIARRCIVLFEYEDVYYKLFNWDIIDSYKNFMYNIEDYAGSNISPSDLLECDIIKAVFENEYSIADLKISENPPTESIKNKLHRDIEMNVNPEYEIDTMSTKIYSLTFDEEIKCIYFNADLYDIYGNEIVKNKSFALFLNGGFSIYDVENIIPKRLE